MFGETQITSGNEVWVLNTYYSRCTYYREGYLGMYSEGQVYHASKILK